MSKVIVIEGSARRNGNTAKVVEELGKHIDCKVVRLLDQRIAPFDYEHRNHDDDFFPIIRDIAEHYDLIIFATPIYWYSMSGAMKDFFDRITDCLTTEKPTGRKLRGKTMGLLICGSDANEVKDFDMPFRNTAGYLGMNYSGYVHTWVQDDCLVEEEVKARLEGFAQEAKGELGL